MAKRIRSASGSRQAEPVVEGSNGTSTVTVTESVGSPSKIDLPAKIADSTPVKFDLSEDAVVASPVVEKPVMERYDGPFPADMFIDRDEPARMWRGDCWALGVVMSAPPQGHLLVGKVGTEFEGYVYVWDEGCWKRPVKK